MKSFYFKCKTHLLHIIADTIDSALLLLPEKYSHLGARADNSVLYSIEDAPVDNFENEDDLNYII